MLSCISFEVNNNTECFGVSLNNIKWGKIMHQPSKNSTANGLKINIF